MVRQAEVETQLVERGVGLHEAVAAGRATAGLGFEELLRQVECGADEARGDRGAESARE